MKQSKLIAVKLIPSILPVSLPTVKSWIFQQKLPVVRLGRKEGMMETFSPLRMGSHGIQEILD